MNETLKTIAKRYSCRSFEGTPLTDEQVDALVQAALAAPSARNIQPWRVIMITDKAFIDELDAEAMSILGSAEDKASYDRMMERGGKMFYNAPCMVMVASVTLDPSRGCAAVPIKVYNDMDCGILSQNVALAAQSLGLGSVICGMAGIPLSGARGAEFKERMGFPQGYEFGIAVLVGTATAAAEPHEPDMSKVSYVKSSI
jgi:Nitroreductase